MNTRLTLRAGALSIQSFRLAAHVGSDGGCSALKFFFFFFSNNAGTQALQAWALEYSTRLTANENAVSDRHNARFPADSGVLRCE